MTQEERDALAKLAEGVPSLITRMVNDAAPSAPMSEERLRLTERIIAIDALGKGCRDLLLALAAAEARAEAAEEARDASETRRAAAFADMKLSCDHALKMTHRAVIAETERDAARAEAARLRASAAALRAALTELVGQRDAHFHTVSAWDAARAALSAAPPPSAWPVPAGWQLVPVEPTEDMRAAGWIDKEDVNPEDIYIAMLAEAPEPPAAQAGEPGA